MKFKPEDFKFDKVEGAATITSNPIKNANLANRKLAEWLESAPVAYGFEDKYGWCMQYAESNEHVTHKCRLVCIEELAPKESCKHEPVVRLEMSEAILASLGKKGLGTIFCKHCQAELVVAEWKAKE